MRIEDIILWILFIIAILFTNSIKLNGIGIRLNFLEKKFDKLENSHIKLANDSKELKSKEK